MVGQIKRGDVFLHTNDRGQTCYRLVASTSEEGISFISFSNDNERYGKIPNIYVKELGYARLDRVDFVRWSKIINFDLRKTTELTQEEFFYITYRLFEFMYGKIQINNKDHTLEYTQSNTDSTNCSSDDKSEENEKNHKPTTIGCDDYGTIEGIFDADYDSEVGMIDNADGDAITVNTDEVEDYDDDFEECTGIDNKHDYNAMTKNAGRAKYIDLFEYVDSRNRTKSGYSPYDSEYAINKKSASRSKHKPIYVSEEDVVRIALSNSTAISKEFNVSKYIANRFILNCKRRLGIDDRFVSDPVHLFQLFDQGYTVEQVVKLTGLNKSSVNQSYKWWEVSRSTNDDDNKSALEKWNTIFDNNDFSAMLAYSKMTINEFAKAEKCTQSIASTIYCRIHDELCRNVYYLMQVVDNEQKYNAENTMKYIEGVKKRKFRDSDVYDAVQYAVNTVESLRDIYIKTYDDHNDILVGAKPIPEEVGDDKEAFITMIANRFCHNVLLSRNRTYTNYQKMLLETGGKISDFIAAFLIIDVDKVSTMVGNCNRKRRNIK